MNNLQDKIISVFLERHALELKDTDISIALVAKGTPCLVEDVRREAQLLSSALFRLQINKDGSCTIRVEPKIGICGDFLSGRCHLSVTPCDRLHLCREFGHCTRQKCTFPHNFTHGQNRKIVENMNCHRIDPDLLVKIIRLEQFRGTPPLIPLNSPPFISPNTESLPRRPPTFPGGANPGYPPRGGGMRGRGYPRGPGRGRGGFVPSSASSFPTGLEMDTSRQLIVSFPSSTIAPQMDMEMVEMILNLRHIQIEKKFDENECEHFRRWTIQFHQTKDVEQLLASPIISYSDVDIKFKSNVPIVDRKSFTLKVSIDSEQDKIDQARFALYIETLTGDVPHTLIDRSTSSEQVLFVQCENDIDFDKVRHAYESKTQLQGKELSLGQVYECDEIEIRYIDEKKSITFDTIQQIFDADWKDIFSVTFPTEYQAHVEFIHVKALRQWMSNIDVIKKKFGINVVPIVDFVETNGDDNAIQLASIPPTNSDTHSTASSSDDKPRPTMIHIRPEWAMIAGHPTFKIEFKNYIRNELGCEIDILNDRVIVQNGAVLRATAKFNDRSLLANRTNNFMQKFKFKTFHLQLSHLNIIRANAATVAFSRASGSNYMVATKSEDMPELISKLFPQHINHLMANSPLKPTTSMPTLNSPRPAAAVETMVYPIDTPVQISFFSVMKFEERLKEYLEGTYNVQASFERSTIGKPSSTTAHHKSERTCIKVKILGQSTDASAALDDISSLFSSLRTRKFEEKTDGSWTKIEDATRVIQHHLTLANLLCICQSTPPATVQIHYFEKTNPQFGVDEQQIDDLIKEKFSSATATLSQQSPTKLIKECADLEATIRKRDDYGKDICVIKDANTIYLFGLMKLVKDYHSQIERLKSQHLPQAYKITLDEDQLNYLSTVAKAEMNKLEKQYKTEGCDVSLTRLRQNSEFLAPSDLHTQIKENLDVLTKVVSISFDIDEPGFEVIVSKEPERLIALAKPKCYLHKKIETSRIHIHVPKARVADVDNESAPPAATAAGTTANSIKINHSKITVSIGDLKTQAVDAIVVCSTSEVLRQDIMNSAGTQVQTEFNAAKSAGTLCETSGGLLPCKKILFLPWSPNQIDPQNLKQSVCTFVSTAISHAFAQGYTTLAFPSIGCGKYGFAPSLIAEHMIGEAQRQLTAHKTKLNVSFVLLPIQQNVFDDFRDRIDAIKLVDSSIRDVPQKKSDQRSSTTIPFDHQMVKIRLTSTNDAQLAKIRHEIVQFAQSCSLKLQITDKPDMLDWPSNIVHKYYDYCLKRRVIPKLDFDNVTVELVGAKDSVHEAERYFYELTSETLKEARIHAVSRGVIWSVEVSSGNWEQYSFKINGIIEDAFLKKLPHVDFMNEKSERCRAILTSMTEQHDLQTRNIRRKLIDATLPDNWESSDVNCKRVALLPTSKEYSDVLKQFDATMKGRYTNIIKIERIQNERWYKQYAAHRDEYKRRYPQDGERLLFHGCLGTSADQIIRECFNRSFAGVNGVVYGCGVYFHSQASYSNQYAKSDGAGQKTMFLARVLIGRTIQGNPSMKVPPSGYDTTTDGQNIFVIYHDAGAYADHLITYR